MDNLQPMIDWVAQAAKEQVLIAKHRGEPVPDIDMGLWQSFQETFPKEQFAEGSYDTAVDLLVAVYNSVTKACSEALNDRFGQA